MENRCTVELNLELGHRAQRRDKETSESFTHDWTVFVQGPQTGDIQHLVNKVVFHLPESYPTPKRVCENPPYTVVESGSMNFLMHVEVFFKNKEKPKKVCLKYDLVLNQESELPVDHLLCEKLTFRNPSKDFKRKLIKAGGTVVGPGLSESAQQPSSDCLMPPVKKIKTSPLAEATSKEGSGGSRSVVENPEKLSVQ